MIGAGVHGASVAFHFAGPRRAERRSSRRPRRRVVPPGIRAGSGFPRPTDLVFKMPHEGTEVKVHKRVDFRVLELIDEASGARVELEGNRVPMTHSKDVIAALVH